MNNIEKVREYPPFRFNDLKIEMPKIIQIIPNTTNTVAVYKNDNGSEFFGVVVAWALVEEVDHRRSCRYTHVVGLDAADIVDFIENSANFVRYETK